MSWLSHFSVYISFQLLYQRCNREKAFFATCVINSTISFERANHIHVTTNSDEKLVRVDAWAECTRNSPCYTSRIYPGNNISRRKTHSCTLTVPDKSVLQKSSGTTNDSLSGLAVSPRQSVYSAKNSGAGHKNPLVPDHSTLSRAHTIWLFSMAIIHIKQSARARYRAR